MNTNQKKLKLVKEGIKSSTLNKMTDSQVDILFSKLQEQVTTTTKQVKTITVPQNIAKSTGADIGNVNVKTDENGNVVESDLITVFDLEKTGWRSFNFTKVKAIA